MTAFLRAAIVVALFVVAGVPAGAWTTEEMNRAIDQTNFIVRDGCSGTLISLTHRLILTNNHCIDDFITTVDREETDAKGKVKKVRKERRQPVPVKQLSYKGYETVGSASYVTDIVHRRKNRDLALLQIKADKIPHASASPILPADRIVTRGERVYVVGNPLGLEATVVEGIVSNVNRTFQFPWAENEDLPMIQFSGGLTGGNSGGALYNDAGQLIGVPAAGARSATFIGLAIPIEIIREVLLEACFASVYDRTANDDACRKSKAGDEESGKSDKED